ncbi:MAG: hypothetical protein JEZ09_11105 [Salinivirgaceae bacterium]|nr:hypothetical protein [Salinivirgaceae bacterium]
MKKGLTLVIVALIFICAPTWAQNKKNTKQLSNAEKMAYERTNKYWGPGTYYCYAPGKPINKMADNSLSHMRDLTGISREDFYTEIAKQGFVEIPKTKKKTWYKQKGLRSSYFYPNDKSYILEPNFEDLYYSPVKENGEYAYAVKTVVRYELYSVQDKEKVIEAIWQFVRELKELKVVLGSFGSNYKKADPKAYPLQRVMSAGWTGFRAGTWLLRTDNGKVQGHWGDNEEILRRTLGMPEFHLVAEGIETDFGYYLMVDLTKEGYVLRYQVSAPTMNNLAPGNTWVKEYPMLKYVYKNGVDADKNAIDLYKNAPFPPVLHDLDKMLHLK